jgi:hypothetical protein
MFRRSSESEEHTYARVAGVSLLLMALLGMFANFFVFESLIVTDDAAETAHNIVTNEVLFRSGIAAFVAVAVLDVLVAWALYVFFRPLHKQLALLSALLRLAYAAVLTVAISNYLGVLQLLRRAESFTALETDQLHAQMMVLINAFSNQWIVGLFLFGLHLFMVGYLMIASGYVSRVIGILLMIAGAGYLIDSTAQILLPTYDDYQTVFLLIVAIPGVIGELSFAFWLLLRWTRMPARRPQARLSSA